MIIITRSLRTKLKKSNLLFIQNQYLYIIIIKVPIFDYCMLPKVDQSSKYKKVVPNIDTQSYKV